MKRKKTDSKLKTIWFFIKKYKLFFAVILALAILSGLLDALNVGLMYPIINNALNLKSSDNTFTEIINPYLEMIPIEDELLRYAFVFIVIALIAFIFKIIYYYLSARFSAKIVKEAKQKMFNKCISSDYQFFIDNKQGEILYKTSQAPNSIAISLQVLSDIFLHLSLAIFVFVTLLTMSWKLVIIVIIIGIIYFQFIRYISTKISYRAGKEKRETGQKERVIVSEYTSGIKQIKVFETFDYWRDLFDNTIDKFWFHHRRNYFWTKIPQILLWMVIYIAIGGAIIFLNFIPFLKSENIFVPFCILLYFSSFSTSCTISTFGI